MKALIIETKENVNTIDHISYHFSRNNIDYTVLKNTDCVEVWKTNNQRGTVSSDCYWDGVNNKGIKMPYFLKQALELIDSGMVNTGRQSNTTSMSLN